jgi:hypothetical protein
MKRKFLLGLSGFAITISLWAGTPVINGTFDGEGVWGAPVGTGDGSVGWSTANAKKIYVTSDNDYVYFGGEFSAEDWMQFIFVVNTKSGGGNGTDPWGRKITYNHTNAPDFLFRGGLAKENYMAWNIWDGSSWTDIWTSRNADTTNGKGIVGPYSGVKDGFIEIRVPKSTIGAITSLNVQFIITGSSDDPQWGSGSFDAVPNDNNSTSWEVPGSATIVSKYASEVILPANLGSFAGELRGSTVNLRWNTLTESNLAGFGIERSSDARNWQVVGYVPARNNAAGGEYQFNQPKAGTALSFYRLKITDKDGSFVQSKMVVIKSETPAKAELIGNPVRSVINVAIYTLTAESIQAELVDMNGRRVSNTVYHHPGGSSVLQIPTQNLGNGNYLLRLNGTETIETLRVMKVK